MRKGIAGSIVEIAGGASLGLVQFRSDTKRGTRQSEKLRQELAHQGQDGSTSVGNPKTSALQATSAPSVIQDVTSRKILKREATSGSTRSTRSRSDSPSAEAVISGSVRPSDI